MITIFHGDNIENSRQVLTEALHGKVNIEIRTIDGKHCTDTDIIQAIESSSLFSDSRIVVIEQLFTPLGRKIKKAKEYIQLLEKNSQDIDCFIWEPKELSKEVIASFPPHTTINLFTYPKRIFSFLDNIKPNNTHVLLSQLHTILITTTPELLWSMMIGRMRQLIFIKYNTTPLTMSSWQRTRLTNQAGSFTMDKLLEMYHSMIDLEYSIKSGVSPLSMLESIRLWIIKL